jgi:hypothetical protein
VWSVPRDRPSALVAHDLDGASHSVAVSLPDGASILSIDIAQDNTRIAMLLQTLVGPRLVVAAIVRDPAQGYVPTTIGAPVLDALLETDTAVDATWVDRLTVATLTRDENGSVVDAFEIGGQHTSLGRPAPSVAIVGGNGRTGLRILGEDHLLQSPRGSSWQSATTEVDLLATQR